MKRLTIFTVSAWEDLDLVERTNLDHCLDPQCLLDQVFRMTMITKYLLHDCNIRLG